MNPISLPVLLEDGSRFDWCRARYNPEIRVAPTHAAVMHRLQGAPTLLRLLETGAVKWATELRCPKTLYCRVSESFASDQTVKWTRDDVDGDMFVIPGLVAIRDLVLRPERNELSLIWSNREYRVRRGWWLVRGTARRTRTLGQSLLRFREDDKLPVGQMHIRRDQSTEELRFHVGLARDIWAERTNRHVQVAALIGALGQMGTAFPEGDDEPPVAREIRHRLEGAGVPAWDDPDSYDPARAATAIEQFVPSEVEGSTETRQQGGR